MKSIVGIQSYGDSVWLDYLRDGLCFARGTILAASVPNFSEIQLFNPAASGVIILVFRIGHASGATNARHLRTHNVALATLVGTGVNLLSGGAAALGELRTAQPAALDGTFVTQLGNVASAPYDGWREWVMELDAAEGVLIAPQNVNSDVTGDFWWAELPA